MKMEASYTQVFLSFSFLISTVSGSCGVHQTLDIVMVYSTHITQIEFSEEITFIESLARALYLHADHTNIAGIGADSTAQYGWGLRDYFTSGNITAKMYNISINAGNGTSDLAPAIDMAWSNILSKNTRSGSTPWLFIITDSSNISTTTSLDAIKAAGIKVGFLTTLSASDYISYASDSRYIVDGMSWWTITSYESNVVSIFCPSYCENFVFYYELPSSMNVIADNNSDVGYYLSETNKAYSIHCCGALESMDYKATASGTIVLQIWRSDTLAYQTTISVSAGSHTYAFNPKLALKEKDVLGWYSPGVSPIGKASNCSGDLCPSDTKQANKMGSLNIGANYYWNSAMLLPDTAFAIKFNVVNGTVPTFVQSSPIYISENTAVGSSVAVVSLTDDAADELVFSPLPRLYFDYNSTSGLITLISPLPVTNTETAYVISLDVFDLCLNTASVAINITTFSEPPTFQNLPTEVELGDDVTEETLLIVVNVTDPNSDSFSCVQTSVLPDTTYFRLDDYMNGTAAVYLNAGAELDFRTTEEYKIFITCTGSSPIESVLTIRILDKSVTTPYTVPAWAAGAIVVSVGSVGVVIAMVCFLIVVILATTDEAEVLPPVEDESAKKPVDDAAQMYKNVDKKERYREGYGEF